MSERLMPPKRAPVKCWLHDIIEQPEARSVQTANAKLTRQTRIEQLNKRSLSDGVLKNAKVIRSSEDRIYDVKNGGSTFSPTSPSSLKMVLVGRPLHRGAISLPPAHGRMFIEQFRWRVSSGQAGERATQHGLNIAGIPPETGRDLAAESENGWP